MASTRRILLASLIGSSIEWLDYFLYSSVAALVFTKLYFPSHDPVVSLLLAYLSFALPFFIRPLGGVLFAHIGDRTGRKKSMIYTLALMGAGTALIGVLPTYQSIGVWAPILLVALRLLQGIGLGGEWGAAVLLAYESAGPTRRGLFGSIPQTGVTIGMLLASLSTAAMSALPGDAFVQWGWRVPFLLSAVLVLLGFWLRSGIGETPDFAAAKRSGKTVAIPLLTVLRQQWREVLVAIFAKMVETGPFYIFTVFVIGYGQTLHYARTLTLDAVAAGAFISTLAIPLAGLWSDRLGRRPVYLLGCVAMAIFSGFYFQLLSQQSAWGLFGATIIAMGVIWPLITATLAPLLSELFHTELRYTGITLGYQIGAALIGGTAPLLATALLALDHGSWRFIALYMAFTSLLSATAVGLAGRWQAISHSGAPLSTSLVED